MSSLNKNTLIKSLLYYFPVFLLFFSVFNEIDFKRLFLLSDDINTRSQFHKKQF